MARGNRAEKVGGGVSDRARGVDSLARMRVADDDASSASMRVWMIVIARTNTVLLVFGAELVRSSRLCGPFVCVIESRRSSHVDPVTSIQSRRRRHIVTLRNGCSTARPDRVPDCRLQWRFGEFEARARARVSLGREHVLRCRLEWTFGVFEVRARERVSLERGDVRTCRHMDTWGV